VGGGGGVGLSPGAGKSLRVRLKMGSQEERGLVPGPRDSN